MLHDRRCQRQRAAVVQERRCEAKAHQRSGTELLWLGHTPAQIRQRGPESVQEEVRVEEDLLMRERLHRTRTRLHTWRMAVGAADALKHVRTPMLLRGSIR